jgi:hypothetical protein
MPTPFGPAGDFSPGDIAERELKGERPPMKIRLNRRDLEQELPKDREPPPPVPQEPDESGEG